MPDEFEDACRKHFAYLTEEYGFTEVGRLEHNRVSVCYRSGILGVDVYGEGYGSVAACDLRRGADVLALAWLMPRRPPDARRARVKRGQAPSQLDQVVNLAAGLRTFAADFLAGDVRRFDEALVERHHLLHWDPLTPEEAAERARRVAASEAGHAFKRGDYAKVIALLGPAENMLSVHQARMLATSRLRTQSDGESDGGAESS